ncbi:hypothetical protein B0J18DRAFT_421473 [Chaetomium sp. MPI-SDFR-AT-0129]|nr:hypothetical protein B0J18DRAFT_421473 [Chaetomium sp. MPI-SDFR-AT-0129]
MRVGGRTKTSAGVLVVGISNVLGIVRGVLDVFLSLGPLVLVYRFGHCGEPDGPEELGEPHTKGMGYTVWKGGHVIFQIDIPTPVIFTSITALAVVIPCPLILFTPFLIRVQFHDPHI